MKPAEFQPESDYATFEHLAQQLHLSLDGTLPKKDEQISEITERLIIAANEKSLEKHAELFMRACFRLFEIGKSHAGIQLGKILAGKASELRNSHIDRRICNIIGGQYCDIADYPNAMEYLERAVTLARKLADPIGEAASLANVIAVLQEMGHYREAIALARRVLLLKADTENARTLKLQCASNGLFAAHRVGDINSATEFLEQGQNNLQPNTDALRRVFFERSRTLFLIDSDQVGRARKYLNESILSLGSKTTPRIKTLISITVAICEWAENSKSASRATLQELYLRTQETKVYHHFVLQALIKCFSDASTPEQVSLGMNYARELVEYTTSVKKAKFYRQLASRRDSSDSRANLVLVSTSIDPFNLARDWLSSSDIKAPPEEGGERRLAKHEELTAIHEDMAKLRVLGIRREIRTDAVDTAENWAIAAEFFDDETGQHCYRVGHLATMLAREIGMDETFCVQVEHAARLHDIGKIAVNEVILLKPGPLDASEMAAMRLHTEVGAQILAGSDDPTLRMAADVARHHHEWWNGAGYPMKLSGKKIPISARICAYADVYDALTHMRAYKKAWTHERAVEEITRLGGSQFDPELLGSFLVVLDRYRADLAARAIPGFADMETNALIASRKKLMETIEAGKH